MWKIIQVSNFGDETVSDSLVAESIPAERTADIMCDALQAAYGGNSAHYFYRVVPQDYSLYTFEP